MKKTSILLTRKFYSQDILYIKDRLDLEINKQYEIIDPMIYTEEEIVKYLDDIDVLFGPLITKKILDKGENLKLIQIPWTGVENLNFKLLMDYNIPVCNTHTNSEAVAEFSVGLLLDLVKKISYHDHLLRRGDWNRHQTVISLQSTLLKDKKICILGYGNIGEKIGTILKGFGCKIIAVTNTKKHVESVYKFFSRDGIVEAMNQADIVFITLPLTDATKNLINSDFMSEIVSKPFIINVSRSQIVNEDFIFDSISKNSIKGYASDVWWKTPARGESKTNPSSYDMSVFPNVLFSPHRAGFLEDVYPHLDGAITNIINISRNRPLISKIDVLKGY